MMKIRKKLPENVKAELSDWGLQIFQTCCCNGIHPLAEKIERAVDLCLGKSLGKSYEIIYCKGRGISCIFRDVEMSKVRKR